MPRRSKAMLSNSSSSAYKRHVLGLDLKKEKTNFSFDQYAFCVTQSLSVQINDTGKKKKLEKTFDEIKHKIILNF